MRVVGLPCTSTLRYDGSCSANGAPIRPSRFIARKFSPLIQMASTEPSLIRPAAFSLRTRLTASTVSLSLTCTSLMSWRCAISAPTHCR